MRVKLLRDIVIGPGGKYGKKGEIHDLEKDVAKSLIRDESAEPVDKEKKR